MPKTSKKKSRINRPPIRPIDRQKMRPWLEDLLDRGVVKGLYWEDRVQQIFVVTWRHAARHGWNQDSDADIFLRWAIHTGKYIEGDEPDPKKWKANFRCALHSLDDVKQLESETKGSKAQRRFRFLDAAEVKTKGKKLKKQIKKEEPEYSDTSDSSYSASDMDIMDNVDTETTLPKFSLLMGAEGSVSQSFTRLNSGGKVTVMTNQKPETPVFTPFTSSRSCSPNSVQSSTGSDISEFSEEIEIVDEHLSSWDTDMLDIHFYPEHFPEIDGCGVIVELMEEVILPNETEHCDDLTELTAMTNGSLA